MTDHGPDWALESFGFPTAGAEIRRAPTGLIQQTHLVRLADGKPLVVQRMHQIFDERVLEDMDAITAALEQAGLETPRPVRTPGGALGVRDPAGKLWRVNTFLDGFTVDRATAALAAEAGAQVGRFHLALRHWERPFSFVRAGVHDTAAHLGRLAAVSGEGPAALRDAILAEARTLPALGELPRRVAHGDLKISNVLFRGEPARAVALLDLDTLGRMSIAYELGDAWRSWCNPLGEDEERTRFDLDIFAAAARGYAGAARELLSQDETASLVAGVQTVALELAARFCVDAFEDRYFGWDPTRFPSRREHNRVRAAGQLHLAREVARARGEAERLVATAFAAA